MEEAFRKEYSAFNSAFEKGKQKYLTAINERDQEIMRLLGKLSAAEAGAGGGSSSSSSSSSAAAVNNNKSSSFLFDARQDRAVVNVGAEQSQPHEDLGQDESQSQQPQPPRVNAFGVPLDSPAPLTSEQQSQMPTRKGSAGTRGQGMLRSAANGNGGTGAFQT